MRSRYIFLLFCFVATLSVMASEPYALITTYDENSGLSQHLVKQIAEDSNGMMWFATWNGINRFDGFEFSSLRPGINEDVRRYSSRYRDIKVSSAGNLWCRIDNKIVSINTRTHSFDDLHSQLESKLGRQFEVTRWWQTQAKELVIDCGDGSYIIIPEENPEEPLMVFKTPNNKHLQPGNRAFGIIGGYDNLAYSRRDDDGALWALTRTGAFVFADSATAPVKVLADLKLNDNSARYCTTDREGNIWFISSNGAHCLTFGKIPFYRVPEVEGLTIMTVQIDKNGRIWVAERDNKSVIIFNSDFELIGYLGANGKISKSETSFGASVYSIYETSDGNMWLGSKPDGLFCLTPSDKGFDVKKILDGNIYDTKHDSHGRLWVATLGDGIKIIDEPGSAHPKEFSLNLPREANACRRLTMLGDSAMLVATTGGLLSVRIDDLSDVKLYTTIPGDPKSLGCVAVMDILPMNNGKALVATESDAVNVGFTDHHGFNRFEPLEMQQSAPSDVALSVSLTSNPGEALIVSHNLVYIVDSIGKTRVYGPSYWGEGTRFRECSPLLLPDGRLAFGLEDGIIISSLSQSGSGVKNLLPTITSVSIENRPDSLLPAFTSRIVLKKDERNLTLRFSALAHSRIDDIVYESRVDDGEWSSLSKNRSITLLDLEPGTFTIEIRAIDISGERESKITKIEVIVEPKWYETLLAKICFYLALSIILLLIARFIIYVRHIKKKQKETLDAYLNLLAKSLETPAKEQPILNILPEKKDADESFNTEKTELTEADREFMDKIVSYVNAHLSDSEAGVDGMAEAARVSRSGLTRKMRSLIGVSPADFLKQARLSHSAKLLTTTSLSIKEIAYECGFADLNYFGKCFKSAFSMTPTAFRKNS